MNEKKFKLTYDNGLPDKIVTDFELKNDLDKDIGEHLYVSCEVITMNDTEIEQKTEELIEESYSYIADTVINGGDIKGLLREIIKEAYSLGQQHMKQKIKELLKAKYGVDGNPALVIIETLEDSNEQRPALEEIIKAIEEL